MKKPNKNIKPPDMKGFIIALFSIFISTVLAQYPNQITNGDERLNVYLPMLENKNVGLVVNHTSVFKGTHLLDTLIAHKVHVKSVFAPEHGFRGKADAGEHVKNNVDSKTGIPVVSLYGKNKKPTKEQFSNLDVIVFDLQDVGARFYTYISTLHYVMETAAEVGVKVIVLDRPNPNGEYIAGPVLDTAFRSFVGMHPIPIVHGLTVGELALMINGEKWLTNGVRCDLEVVSCLAYTHSTPYELPIKPSPNLPNHLSVKLYPTLCLFEPTVVSVGRGTYFPFQVIGVPEDSAFGNFHFIPQSIDGMSKYPKHEGEKCFGIDFRDSTFSGGFSLKYLVEFYKNYNNQEGFFTSDNFFCKLIGTDQVLNQIRAGISAQEIEATWQEPLEDYKEMREKYLLYD